MHCVKLLLTFICFGAVQISYHTFWVDFQQKGLETVNISDLRNRQKKRQKEKVIQYVREQETKQLRRDEERLEEHTFTLNRPFS